MRLSVLENLVDAWLGLEELKPQRDAEVQRNSNVQILRLAALAQDDSEELHSLRMTNSAFLCPSASSAVEKSQSNTKCLHGIRQ